MLEQGVDRIVAQVVDPKVHHTFRPQVERIVRRFLSPNSHVEEDELPPVAPPPPVENQEAEPLTADEGNEAGERLALVSHKRLRRFSSVSLCSPAASSSADVQIQTSAADPIHDPAEDEMMDISLPEEEEEERGAEVKDEPQEEPGKDGGEAEEEEKDAEMEEVKEEGDAAKENSSKSSGKTREENRETDSQKPCSVKQKTRERLREGTTLVFFISVSVLFSSSNICTSLKD